MIVMMMKMMLTTLVRWSLRLTRHSSNQIRVEYYMANTYFAALHHLYLKPLSCSGQF